MILIGDVTCCIKMSSTCASKVEGHLGRPAVRGLMPASRRGASCPTPTPTTTSSQTCYGLSVVLLPKIDVSYVFWLKIVDARCMLCLFCYVWCRSIFILHYVVRLCLDVLQKTFHRTVFLQHKSFLLLKHRFGDLWATFQHIIVPNLCAGCNGKLL